jgi:protein TonB
MTPERIMQADLLDLIFENRNKAYGAYELRKYYNSRLNKSLALLAVAIGLFSLLAFMHPKRIVKGEKIDDPICIYTIPIVPEKAPSQPQQPPSPQQQSISSGPIVIVDSTVDVLPVSDTATIAVLPFAGVPGGDPGPPTDIFPSSGKGGDTVAVLVSKPDINVPIANPDYMPEYPGGMSALKKFLERNLQTPDDLMEGQVVEVKIKFVVGYDGALKGFQVLQDGGTSFNNEVIRVLKKMPQWIPGKSAGENVSVYYALPVKFVAPQ